MAEIALQSKAPQEDMHVTQYEVYAFKAGEYLRHFGSKITSINEVFSDGPAKLVLNTEYFFVARRDAPEEKDWYSFNEQSKRFERVSAKAAEGAAWDKKLLVDRRAPLDPKLPLVVRVVRLGGSDTPSHMVLREVQDPRMIAHVAERR